MAEDQTAPSLNLTAKEKRVFGQLFRQADSEGIGVVTGEVAVKFFEKTRLEPRILGEIWQIADKENRGLLTPAGFGIVLRLIGHYQAGRDPAPELALRPGPLPKFDNGSVPALSPTVQPPPGPPPSALQPQPSGSGPIRVPPLIPEKAAQYAALFDKSGAQGGILPGEQAKQIFERAGLPNEILGRIWNLADTEQKGALQVTEFVIAMHLLASFKTGQLRALPSMLPPGLYEAAARRPASRQTSVVSSVSTIPRQLSGSGVARVGSPLARSSYAIPPQIFTQNTGSGDWAISPADKMKFDGIYNNLDKANRGFITGNEAVPFFSESKLPEEALAQIWDLADINSAGRLTRDEFAVAMYLIRQQRGKRDERELLPDVLPANLIPPSMRNQPRPEAVPTAPEFDAAPVLPKSAAEDLFGLDALSSPNPSLEQVPAIGGSESFTGVHNTDPFGNGPSSPSQHPALNPQVFKSFAPTSSFGLALNQQVTGGSNSTAPLHSSTQFQNSASEDLLGDNDPEISKKLTNETTELGNLSNQVGSLSKQMQEVQGQRAASQNELNQAGIQKREFENRLAQLRTLYEQELKDVRSLEEHLIASRNEIKKLQTEIAMVEGTFQDLQNQHSQMITALEADQHENANLKERMRTVNAEIAQLKPVLEKLRSDARQQKGLVTINKKQLATNEAERDKLKNEAEDFNRSIREDGDVLTPSSMVHSPALSASPAPSSMSATNPFFRRQGSSSETAHSHFAALSITNQQNDRSFENVFGPAFGSSAITSEVPATSFKQTGGVRSPSFGSAASVPICTQTTGGNGFQTPPPSSSPAPAFRDLPKPHEVPPPLSESRQISSKNLPFSSHEDSITSSRQVSPPRSKLGEGSTGGDTPTNYMAHTPTSSTIAVPVGAAASVLAGLDRKSNSSPSVPDSIPGAFPGGSQSSIAATPTGGSTISDQAAADPFAFKAVERSGTAKDDFDSAFAGFGTAKIQERPNTSNSSGSGSAGGANISSFHKEFPPIAELENDDDSESDSDGGGGFDDDFAPASPGHVRKPSSSDAPLSETASNLLPTRPTQSSVPNLGTNSTTTGAQSSLPGYGNVNLATDQAHSEAQQYPGLLSSREVPPSTSSEMPLNSTSATQAPFSASLTTSKPAPPAKIPLEDEFDEFDDLEDAKEGDANDDLANVQSERSGLDDFNPVFDSPPVSKATDDPPQHNGFGSQGSFGEYTQSPAPGKVPIAVPAVNDDQDWDAIFAGLDSPSTATVESTQIPDNSKANGPSTTHDSPQVGRALTESGARDDPHLRNLMSMGYARNEALAALEKYDYDLERAANYLASQS